MKIDSSTYDQLSVTKWVGGKSFKDTNQTFCLDISSNCHDIIEVQEYEVIESRPLIPIEKDSAQELSLLSRGLTFKERMIRKRVATIYQNYANISFANNVSRIDVRI
ncbi:MAG: hypothetical protein U9N83_16960 [Thermodesulfobacteriota bacterium]|nr:hypothetical protein [Thermodesulfobacteriota bacterium]